MDTSIHTLQTLFCQLGLADDEEHINTFIEKHRPFPRPISGANHRLNSWLKRLKRIQIGASSWMN